MDKFLSECIDDINSIFDESIDLLDSIESILDKNDEIESLDKTGLLEMIDDVSQKNKIRNAESSFLKRHFE